MPFYIENYFLTTTEVSKMVGRSPKTIKNWMLHGVTIRDQLIKLQYQRSGKWYHTTKEWLDAFMVAINVDTPPIIETTSQRQRRAAKAVERFKSIKAN